MDAHVPQHLPERHLDAKVQGPPALCGGMDLKEWGAGVLGVAGVMGLLGAVVPADPLWTGGVGAVLLGAAVLLARAA